MKVVIMVAVASNGIIGKGDGLPWPRIPEDMVHFKNTTLDHSVIMGRKTWESIPERFRPLPGRDNIVISRQPGWAANGALAAIDLPQAIALARTAAAGSTATRVFVIGGGQLYAQALPLADELMVTEIDVDFEGDTSFPVWNRADFEEISRVPHPVTSQRTFEFAFVLYRRRPCVCANMAN